MLIEVIVATTLFVVVMTMAAEAILSVVNATRKAQSVATIMTNLHFILEGIGRDVKTGEIMNCGSPCAILQIAQPILGSSPALMRSVQYEYTGQKITQKVFVGPSVDFTTGNPIDLTSPQEVVLEDAKFYVQGVGNDNIQPRVLVILKGYTAGKESLKTNFNLQTSVTQRIAEAADY